jgi:drug/metabolite transporter (DMT)-like permease
VPGARPFRSAPAPVHAQGRHGTFHTMPPTPPISVLLFLIAALLGALGQFLYKSGADRADGSVAGYLLSPRILAGVVAYVAVMVLFVAAFRRGGALTVLYPVYASTFIFAALIALASDGTPIRPINVLGMLLLIAGMYCMGAGALGGRA